MNNGCIILTSLNELKSCRYDKAFFIVRSNKLSTMSLRNLNLEPCPVLSPSKELFHEYLGLKAVNNWNQSSFDSQYLPKFIHEIVVGCKEETSDQKIAALNNIYAKVKSGERIALVCYCKDLCHRFIIGGLLAGVGLRVVDNHGDDVKVSQYYSMYLKEKERANNYANAR